MTMQSPPAMACSSSTWRFAATSLALIGAVGAAAFAWKWQQTRSRQELEGVEYTALLKDADEEQQKMMEEECILVDENDKPLGGVSKKESALHRSFLVCNCLSSHCCHQATSM